LQEPTVSNNLAMVVRFSQQQQQQQAGGSHTHHDGAGSAEASPIGNPHSWVANPAGAGAAADAAGFASVNLTLSCGQAYSLAIGVATQRDVATALADADANTTTSHGTVGSSDTTSSGDASHREAGSSGESRGFGSIRPSSYGGRDDDHDELALAHAWSTIASPAEQASLLAKHREGWDDVRKRISFGAPFYRC
jgi:hypothetical protein